MKKRRGVVRDTREERRGEKEVEEAYINFEVGGERKSGVDGGDGFLNVFFFFGFFVFFFFSLHLCFFFIPLPPPPPLPPQLPHNHIQNHNHQQINNQKHPIFSLQPPPSLSPHPNKIEKRQKKRRMID